MVAHLWLVIILFPGHQVPWEIMMQLQVFWLYILLGSNMSPHTQR